MCEAISETDVRASREITAEDDRDAIVTKGNLSLKNGRAFQSNCAFLFQLRDGKIASGKEFLDAIHVTEIFGAPDRSFVTDIQVDSLTAINRNT
jgi:ketosteroid isomerase-like protein